MAITYTDLVNVGGTIYDSSGQGYTDPTHLAGAMGIVADTIDWGQIKQSDTIPGVSSEISAADLTGANISVGDGAPYDPSSILDASDPYLAQMDYYRNLYEETQKKKAEAEEKLASTGAEDKLAEMTESPFKMAEELETQTQKELEKMGISEEMIAQIGPMMEVAKNIRTNIVNLEEERDLALTDIEGKTVSLQHIAGEQAVVERKYNIRIAAESARLSAQMMNIQTIQGSYEMARNMASQMVEAMAYDERVQYERLRDFVSLYKTEISNLEDREQAAIQNALIASEARYKDKKETATIIGNYIMTAAQYGVDLGIDPTTASIEDATSAFSRLVAPEVKSAADFDKYLKEQGLLLDKEQVSQSWARIAIDKESNRLRELEITQQGTIDSLLDIGRFKDLYGYQPPSGMSINTAQQLQAVLSNQGVKDVDIKRALYLFAQGKGAEEGGISIVQKEDGTLEYSYNDGKIIDEQLFRNSLNKDQLESLVKELGARSWRRFRSGEVNNVLKSANSGVEILLSDGYEVVDGENVLKPLDKIDDDKKLGVLINRLRYGELDGVYRSDKEIFDYIRTTYGLGETRLSTPVSVRDLGGTPASTPVSSRALGENLSTPLSIPAIEGEDLWEFFNLK